MKGKLALRPTLFWETNPKKLDEQKDAEFIIGRVLDFGNLKEWKAIKDFYGLTRIKKVIQRHIFSDPRSANFWAMILGISLKNLRCKKKLSLKTPKAFSMR